MKVVLFCGGLGMRLREYSERIPKPMVTIGYRPMLWHVMKYYGYYGHNDFVLCLGYKADLVKSYFLNYNECLSNDFILSNGGKDVQLQNSDIQDWRIAFVDTGTASNIGRRLRAVQSYVAGEDVFLANYADGLTDLPLPQYVDQFLRDNKIAGFLGVRPPHSFHVVSLDGRIVTDIQHVGRSDIRMNGGYFIFRRQIFDYIKDGEDLVEEPFQRLIREQQLVAYTYDGFWACMDTFKDKQQLDDMYARGEAPWEVWKAPAERPTPTAPPPQAAMAHTADGPRC
jgi:glucose-1-phosphate cytidylyltransferase